MNRTSLGPSYRRLWWAATVSNLGDGVTLTALPLLAVTLTDDARLIGGLAFASALPWLLFALVAGALVDRLDRRLLLVRVDLVRAGLVAVVAVAAATGTATMPLLYAVAFLLGMAETLFDNAAMAILPAIVEPAQLETANGRQYMGEVITNQFAGPPLGALLFTVAVAAPFVLDGATFLVAAVLLAGVRPRPHAAAPPQLRRSLRAEIGEGVRWLARHRLLRTLALLLGAVNFAANLVWGTFVLLATREIGLSERAFGVVITASAVGAVLGGLVAGRVTAWLGQTRALVASVAALAVSYPIVGAAGDAVTIAGALAVAGVGVVVWNVITVSLRQAIVPPELLGRVNSVYRAVGYGATPIGALAGGFLADALGLRAPWFIAAALVLACLVVAAVALRQPALDAARAQVGSVPG